MKKGVILISMVSWEDRFFEGMQRLLHKMSPVRVVLFFYDKWEGRTLDARSRATEACEAAGAAVTEVELRYGNPVRSWEEVRRAVDGIDPHTSEVLVDISTMPREAIWALLSLLGGRAIDGRYAYHNPREYGSWLSRDPGRPRLALKLAGEMKFGATTMVVVVTGFDYERTVQVVRTFDPASVRLGVQRGRQFENTMRNREVHRERLGLEGESCPVEFFEVDAYAEDHGFRSIADVVEPHVGEKNIVMASLGPKLSAIALYRVQRMYPSTGLVYAPSGEYNEEYSRGTAETVIGVLPR